MTAEDDRYVRRTEYLEFRSEVLSFVREAREVVAQWREQAGSRSNTELRLQILERDLLDAKTRLRAVTRWMWLCLGGLGALQLALKYLL